jgi:predicted N-formylglutamate amidohydrolase
VTCEHGGNDVPPDHASVFAGREKLLVSHRGFDPGALGLARRIAEGLPASLHYTTVTRLLVDLNRSPHHPRLFSPVTRPLSESTRAAILAEHYHPYRQGVAADVRGLLRRHGLVVHLSVHTFAPQLNGTVRDVDVGLLYNPARPLEKRFGQRWQAHLRPRLPRFRVRRNRPYLGVSDGLVTFLRRELALDGYIGLELEVSQRFPRRGGRSWLALQQVLFETFELTLAEVD